LRVAAAFVGSTLLVVGRWASFASHRTGVVLLVTLSDADRRNAMSAAMGDALRDIGQYEQADRAYAEALNKDSEDRQALWGAALVDMQHRNFSASAERLQKLLAIDPQYKFGDVSLAYGKSLYELRDLDRALEHLEGHVRRWRHPEALFLVATIHAERGNPAEARAQLQAMLLDINGSPPAIARKHGMWKSRARRMFRTLPRR
jgi:tetratricopeptide (TPR) repeat protein